MIAAGAGLATPVRFAHADLARPDSLADLLRRETPDLLFTAASLQTWWLADLLPEAAAATLRLARFGAWLPVHLAPTLALMQAAREAGFTGATVAAPYPDVVNCVLGRIGLAPTCGVGNVDEMATKVAIQAAGRIGAAPADLRVRLVAHHALEPLVFGPGAGVPVGAAGQDGAAGHGGAAGGGSPLPPFFLRVEQGGRDITDAVAAGSLLFSPCPLPPGRSWCRFTAAVTVRLVRALCGDADVSLHAPGPLGLPGGYPIVAGRMRVRIDPPVGLTEAEAIALNERSHRFEGIERIDPDGTVVFRGEDAEALRAALGYSCARLPPAEAAARGRELVDRFREFARRHGVDVPREGRR
jgi:hypothetical protein